MRKALTALILAASAAILTACSQAPFVENEKNEITAGTMFIRHELADGYSILEEQATSVCYLEYDRFYKHAITVMLNPDGTPKKWESAGG